MQTEVNLEKAGTVSIVIPSYNTKSLLYDCLNSIVNNSKEIPEIIVIDDCSNDGSYEDVKRDFNFLIIDKNSNNLGFVRTVNKGISLSSGKFILVLNSDTIFIEDSITKMTEFMLKHENCGIAGCKIIDSKKNIQYTCARRRTTFFSNLWEQLYLSNLFPKNRIFGSELMSYWDHNECRDVDAISGAFMMIRRECLDQIGYFDEIFNSHYEDIDLCYRAKKAGWHVLYNADTTIIHLSGQSFGISPRSRIINFQSKYAFFKKYYPSIPSSLLKIISIGSLLGKIALLLTITIISKITKNNNDIHLKKLESYVKALRWHFNGCSELYLKD